jgi:hypothetical protein
LAQSRTPLSSSSSYRERNGPGGVRDNADDVVTESVNRGIAAFCGRAAVPARRARNRAAPDAPDSAAAKKAVKKRRQPAGSHP